MKNVNIWVLLGIFIAGVGVGVLGTISFRDGEPTTVTAPTPIEEKKQVSPVDEAAMPSEEYNFRKTSWGMDKRSVKASERGNELVEEGSEYLAYKGYVSGLDCYVYYTFTESGRLAECMYDFRKKYTNENRYINDYKNIKSLLIKKYGQPDPNYKEVIWRNDLYKNDPSRYGFSVSMGHHAYMSRWETDDTRIYLALTGNNFEVTLLVQYKSILYEKEMETSEEKEALDKF